MFTSDPYFFSFENPIIVSFVVFTIILAMILIFLRIFYKPLLSRHKTDKKKYRVISNKLFFNDPNPILRFSDNGKLIHTNFSAEELIENSLLDVSGLFTECVTNSKVRSDNYCEMYTFNQNTYEVIIKHFKELSAIQLYLNDKTEFLKQENLIKDYEEKVKELRRIEEKKYTEKLNNIARELHDSVNHDLLLLREGIDDSRKEDLNDIIHKVKNISTEIKPIDFKKQKFSTAVYLIGEKLTRNTDIEIFIDLDETLDNFTPEKLLNIYRIIQESVNNIVKYAQADYVEIVIFKEAREINLSVSDNGKGFKPHKIKENYYTSEGLGIVNIQERIGELEGFWEIDSILGEGTTILITIPYRSNEEKSFNHNSR
ncbi:MAG: sensor histidine kinase [Rhodothermaceae bacterium]